MSVTNAVSPVARPLPRKVARSVAHRQKPSPPPLTKFTLFPKLPAELQVKIWAESISGRVVEISGHYVRHEDTEATPKTKREAKWDVKWDIDGFFSETKPTPALLVSKDSRAAIIHLYPFMAKTNIRFNAAVDTLCFRGTLTREPLAFVEALSDEEKKNLNTVAIQKASFRSSSCWPDEHRLDDKVSRALAHLNPSTKVWLVINVKLGCRQVEEQDDKYHKREFQGWEKNALELHEDFPLELKQRSDLYVSEQVEQMYRDLKGTYEKFDLIWGWRPEESKKYLRRQKKKAIERELHAQNLLSWYRPRK